MDFTNDIGQLPPFTPQPNPSMTASIFTYTNRNCSTWLTSIIFCALCSLILL